MTNGPVEPSADAREFAAVCFQFFTALRLEGFSEQQALIIIGQMIAANTGGGQS
jgi:hypothetical protein